MFACLCKFLNKTNGQMDVQKSTVSYIEKQTKYHIVYSMFFFHKQEFIFCVLGAGAIEIPLKLMFLKEKKNYSKHKHCSIIYHSLKTLEFIISSEDTCSSYS